MICFVSASSKLGTCRDSECSVELIMGSAELTTRALSEVNIVDHETSYLFTKSPTRRRLSVLRGVEILMTPPHFFFFPTMYLSII